jgi:hypothetical protein
MAIPRVMYRMHLRAVDLTDQLKFAPSKEEFEQFLSLIGLDPAVFAGITDYDGFVKASPRLIQMAEARGQRVKLDPKQSWRVLQFIYEGYVRKALDEDRGYQRLKQILDKMSPVIPTVELSQAILAYNKLSIVRCSSALMVLTKDERILKVIPIPYQLDAKREMDTMDEKLKLMLAKVTQCIDEYYGENKGKGVRPNDK